MAKWLITWNYLMPSVKHMLMAVSNELDWVIIVHAMTSTPVL
jgi:hypothetical protein